MTTRAQVEDELIARVGGWLTAAGLDGTTADGTNASLTSPIGYGLRTLAASAVTDVADADLDQLYDVAELRALENIYQNYRKVDGKAGPVEGKADQLAQRIKAALDAKRAAVVGAYGVAALGTLTWASVGVSYGAVTSDEFERPPNFWP